MFRLFMCENGEFMSLMLKLPSFFWTRITRISKRSKIILTKGRILEQKQKLLSPFQIYRFLRERIAPPHISVSPPFYFWTRPYSYLGQTNFTQIWRVIFQTIIQACCIFDYYCILNFSSFMKMISITLKNSKDWLFLYCTSKGNQISECIVHEILWIWTVCCII